MNKEEFLKMAAAKYEEIQALNKQPTFWITNKDFLNFGQNSDAK